MGAISSHPVLFGPQWSKIMGALVGEMKEFRICMPVLTAAASVYNVLFLYVEGIETSCYRQGD